MTKGDGAKAAALIRDRIVGFGRKSAEQFTANPLNWRLHPESQRQAVAASLRELGWIDVAIENVTTGHLIDGHERIQQALRDGGDVPFITVELTEEEERLALALLDPLTNMATTDAAKLDALLSTVQSGEAAVQAMLAELAARSGVYPIDIPDPQPQREPQLESECFIELYCSRDDLADFQATLDEWGKRGTVTINIS